MTHFKTHFYLIYILITNRVYQQFDLKSPVVLDLHQFQVKTKKN